MNQQQRRYVLKRIEAIENQKITEASGRQCPEEVNLDDLLRSGKIRFLPADKLRAVMQVELEKVKVKADEASYYSSHLYTGNGCSISVKVHDILTPGSIGALAMFKKSLVREQGEMDRDRNALVGRIVTRATEIKDNLMVGDAEGALAAIAAFEKEEF